MDDSYQKLIEFLTGDCDSIPVHGLIRSNKEVFRLSSPLDYYLRQVNKFLFSGGIQIDIESALEEDPRQELLDTVYESNQMDAKLEQLWKRCSIVGEVLVTITVNPDREGYYSYNFFEKPEFDYERDSTGCLQSVTIMATRVDKDGKEWVYRQVLDERAYYDYPLVEANKAHNFDWDKYVEETPHGYRRVPAVVIRNTTSLTNSRGKTDFTKPVLDMVMQLVLQTMNIGENFYFFGNPIFNSPDPEDFMTRIRQRKQAVEKLPENEGGKTEVINFTPVPKEVFDYVKDLKRNIYEALGINWNDNAHSTDLSSLTLRILNEDTINTAETKWVSYVEQGLEPLFEMTLLMSAVDGLTSLVNPLDKGTYSVEITRNRPYFSETPAEQLTQLTIAESMINMGIKRSKALQKTVFPNLSEEQILEMMEGDF